MVLESWSKWGVPEKDKKKIGDHIATIQILRDHGLKGASVIGAYHSRRVAPLMARAVPLHQMGPGVPAEGTSLAEGPQPDSEIAQHIKEAMESMRDSVGVSLDFVFSVPGCPPMRSDPSFVEFISYLLLSPFS